MSRENVRAMIEALDRLSVALVRLSFSLLDLALAELPQEERPPTSWEVEREAFLRRIETETKGEM